MQRKFVNNLLFIVLLNLLVKPFWILGIDLTVQNRVGPESYGFYASIFSFSILLNIILDFGITNYNSRNIAQHAHMLGRYFSGIFNVKILLGIIYLLATIIFGWLIGYEETETKMLFFLGINQLLSSMILYLRSNIAGLLLFKTEGILSIMDRALMIIFCGILLWGNVIHSEFKIEWFVYAQFWAYLLTAIAAFVFVYKKATFYRFQFDFKIFRIILKESLPFALLVLLMSFYYRLDSVMLERLLADGKRTAGVYAQSYRLLEGFNMFAYLFAGILLPIFSKMLKNKESVVKLLHTSFNLIFIPAIAIATISMIYSNEIMGLLYTREVTESAKVYAVLMFSFVAIALTYIYGTLLTANGSLKQLNLIALVGFLLNFSLNCYLIPIYKSYGAAVATLITQFIVVTLQIVISKKLLQMKYSLAFIAKQLILIIACVGLAIGSKNYFESFLLHSLLICLTFGVVALMLGLVKREDFINVIRQKS